MLARKREKFGAQVRSHVARWMADNPFVLFANRPTANQVIDMFMAARFGPGDPLFAGGDRFACEYLLDEMNDAVALFQKRRLKGDLRVIDPESHAIRVIAAQSENWGNLFFVLEIDETLVDHWTKLNVDDFDLVHIDGDVLDYAVEKESRAFGFRIQGSSLVPIREAYAAYGDPVAFTPKFLASPWKANDKCTIYFFTVGPLDRLLSPEERSRHGVQGFSRRLASGKLVSVRAHDRRNPGRLAARVGNLDEVGHVVYRAYDADGALRYYGEGTTTRPGHVNSGASHNFKLNEHFFRRGPMRVEVFARGLSKDEALAVERLCIRGHAGSALWNIKDYERQPDDDR